MNFIHLDTVDSTNNWAKLHAAELADRTIVTAREQTAGRGQRGNRWLAAAGQNATFSIFFRPDNLKASQQQVISEVAALAVAETLDECGVGSVRIKWPNDIYAGDRKIAGILIECSLDDAFVGHAVVGIGLNVNQADFPPELPNPTSIALETRRSDDPERVISRVGERFGHLCAEAQARELIHNRYMRRLYRNDGALHPFALPGGTRFEAAIADVAPEGHLSLRHADGTLHRYAFKEVEFII